MTTDHFQQEVLQRLSVIETKTDRVLEDVSGVTARVTVLEAEHNKQYGFKTAIVATGGLILDGLAHWFSRRGH